MTQSERGGGALSAPMAVAVLAMVIAIGLGIDGVRAAQGIARADTLAEEAARAAGQSLDPAQLQRGVAVVDPAAAVVAARAFLTDAGVEGTVTVAAPDRVRVEVTISRPTVVLGLVGRDELVSTGAAEAQLVAVAPDRGAP